MENLIQSVSGGSLEGQKAPLNGAIYMMQMCGQRLKPEHTALTTVGVLNPLLVKKERMIIKYPCQKCEPGKGDDYNVLAIDKDGQEPMICGNKSCLEKSYCQLLEKQLVKKEE